MSTPGAGRPRDRRPGAAGNRAPHAAAGADIGTSRGLAHTLDDLVRIPGTTITLGVDALLGLVPGVGDAATTAMASLILVDAVRAQVPLPVLARMVANCGLDALLGQLPLVGDLADIGFRSNRKNLRLLERAVADPRRVERNSVAYLAAASAMVLLAVLVMIGATLFALWWVGKVLGIL
ncbi:MULTISPECIES: DUF4112 domain-containing protein [unclassified Luteococcus]|uniref:DUF4112 domain-containing protein n=1 Tax=unclassified Luteococcus TaxID=2639923 RepID=UPI00313EF829